MTEPLREQEQPDDEIGQVRAALAALDLERQRLISQLDRLLLAAVPVVVTPKPVQATSGISNNSTAAEKIALFRRLFSGRTDVVPLRWENQKSGKSGYSPACTNEWVRGVCGKPQVKCGDCPNQAFIGASNAVVECHLRGEDRIRKKQRETGFVAGVYPLLFDDTCYFLAVDFDKKDWIGDAKAFLETCRDLDVPAALERSRSGNGGHVWIFFSESIAASEARRLGTLLLTRTMNRRPEIGFASYDRLFPSQDTMPRGGFGNLIALPLQRLAREKGNSVFVDDALTPYEDQWGFLATLRRLSSADVATKIGCVETDMPGGATGVRLPVDDENADEPWKMAPSRRRQAPKITEPMPVHVGVILADQVFIDRAHLPSSVVAQLVRVAAFQNPEFYRAQAMRMPTYGKPRIISCAELHPQHVGLPRGCLDEALEVLKVLGIKPVLKDERHRGQPLALTFLGTLHDVQAAAVVAIEPHDYGVLAATTAFGKTVVGAKMILITPTGPWPLAGLRRLSCGVAAKSSPRRRRGARDCSEVRSGDYSAIRRRRDSAACDARRSSDRCR